MIDRGMSGFCRNYRGLLRGSAGFYEGF